MSRWIAHIAFYALILITCVTKNVAAAPIPTGFPRSFAVFMVSYNTHNDYARGGVCGTAFFISPTQAVTAYHVLAAKSFKPLPGFERVRLWLVHEGYPAVEIKPEYLTYEPGKDRTLLHFPKAKKVDQRFVFTLGTVGRFSTIVMTEGFVANTDGPTLIHKGSDVDVAAVPHLQRLILTGRVLRVTDVTLKSPNINLRGEPSVQLSYQPIVGISGGPVVSDGKVIAMNSFAEPSTFKQTWAVDLQSQPGVLGRP